MRVPKSRVLCGYRKRVGGDAWWGASRAWLTMRASHEHHCPANFSDATTTDCYNAVISVDNERDLRALIFSIITFALAFLGAANKAGDNDDGSRLAYASQLPPGSGQT